MIQINRSEIETCIFRYVKDVLKKGIPAYKEEEIKEAIKIFYDFSICKLGYAEIDGFSKIILKPLQSLANNSTDLESLRTISTSLEAFLKRIIVLLKLYPYNDIRNATLIPLLKKINIVTQNSFPKLDKESLENYRGKEEYLEYICHFYITRNEIHNAYDWSIKEITNRLEATLVVYIYTILIYINRIKPLVAAKLTNLDGSILDTQENKWLYDFISYGKSANELKTQIVDACILNSIFDHNSIQKVSLEIELKKQLGQSIPENFLKRRIKKLQTDERIIFDMDTEIIYLTKHENGRINKVRENFKDNKDLFILYLEDILEDYNIKSHKVTLIDKLKELFTENFNLDLVEIYDHGDDGVSAQYQIINNFINEHLLPIVLDKDKANLLMKDLLNLCEESDFLLCISASSVLNNITNSDKYQSFINQPIKNVYLDTQVILYSLCLDFRKAEKFENTMYRITKELCKESLKHTDIKLLFSSHYITEISYQLKNALGLIMYENLFEKHHGKLSTNIFYQFYTALKNNNAIENNFYLEDFMEECFSLYEDDLYDQSFFYMCDRIIRDKIKELSYIEVIDIPACNNLPEIEKLMELTINDKKLPIKTYHILKNDAIMLSHLSNENEHLNVPFFLTWDKSFLEFRKEYNSKFLRRSTHLWHIFSPSKFINHIALMHMQIDPKSISDDFLSVIDSFGLTQKAKTIYDIHSRFLDIKNITKEQRYKYISILSELFNDKEFSYESDEQVTSLVNSNYDGILDALNEHYYRGKQLNIKQYRLMLLEEEYFIKVARLIKIEILNNKDDHFSIQNSESFFSNIDSLVKEFIDVKQHKSI